MAGGANLSNEDEGFNEINIVPFVDIVLVLLIIFMVTTEFARDEEPSPKELPQNVQLDLPKAATGGEGNTSLLSIAMTRDGGLYLNGESATMDAIKAQVESLKAANKPVEAFVAADERLSHGAVLTVVDTLRQLGVGNVGFNTKPMEIE